MKKRHDHAKARIKAELFEIFGCYCMCCRKKFKKEELQLHHIKPFRDVKCTTFENSSLVCNCCHQEINRVDNGRNKQRYDYLNSKIVHYKYTH